MNTRRIVIGLIAVVGVLVLGLVAYRSFLAPPPAAATPPPSSAQAAEPDVVSAEAQVVPVREANLTFNLGGEIVELPVKEGDQVKAGDVLAKLETRDVENAVRQAEAALKQAEAQLAKAKAGARPEELASAEAAVGIAEQGVSQAEAAVEVAKGNVAAAQASVQAAQANLAKLTAGPTAGELEIARQQVEQAKNLLLASQGARDALNAVRGSADYEGAQGQVQSNEAQVRIAELRYEDLKDGPRPEDLQAARAEVARAQAGLQTARGEALRAESGVGAAKAQLEQAQAQRDLVKAGARAEDIQVAEAAVAQSQAALDSARAKLGDSILTAPFDGTIGQVNAQVGELASPSMPVLTVGDLSGLRVETQDLSEVDVERVKIGQDVQVSVDAVPGKEFKGTVALIAPQAIERRGDTVYTVKIDLVEPTDPRLRWGMTAFVDIQTGNQ